MDPFSPLAAFGVLMVAIMAVSFIVRWEKTTSPVHLYASLDGLRGYLAFFVFLHHSAIWYSYLHVGRWESVPSHLYTHLGQDSVALFFMITGFLFLSKILGAHDKPINWTQLYITRIMRLTPLYLFMVVILLIIVMTLSNFTLHEPVVKFIQELIRWTSFNILFAPNINGIENTNLIVASVTWSLAYEWFFYLSLPLLAFCVRVTPPVPYILLSVVAMVGFAWWGPEPIHLAAFGGGIVAAVLARNKSIRSYADRTPATILALMCLVTPEILFRNAHNLPTILLLSVAFSIIACGNTIFGLLKHPLSCVLGEMSYSIYLLHGLLLFIMFRFVIGLNLSARLIPCEYWSIICVCSAILVMTCYVTYRFIEAPAIRSVPGLCRFLQLR